MRGTGHSQGGVVQGTVREEWYRAQLGRRGTGHRWYRAQSGRSGTGHSQGGVVQGTVREEGYRAQVVQGTVREEGYRAQVVQGTVREEGYRAQVVQGTVREEGYRPTPSKHCRNSFLSLLIASCSPSPLLPSMASHSSGGSGTTKIYAL